jgi:hypothetical protein
LDSRMRGNDSGLNLKLPQTRELSNTSLCEAETEGGTQTPDVMQ